MADKEKESQEKGGSPLKLVIIIVGATLGLVGVTVGALIYLQVISLPGSNSAQVADEDETPARETLEKAIYVDLNPEFTVSFPNPGNARYLQVELQAMTRDPDVEPVIKKHMPMIRNDLMVLLGEQQADRLRSREGKEELQTAALSKIQDVVEAELGRPGVEAVYFTRFVMQ